VFERRFIFTPRQSRRTHSLAKAHYRLAVAYDRIGLPEKARQQFQLHDEIEKLQAGAAERQRREVKQFLVVLEGQPGYPPPPK
jgi:hypothetical protein